MDKFEDTLRDDILQSQKYRISLFLVPTLSNHKTSENLALEFVKFDENDPTAIKNHKKCIEMIREKTVEQLEHHLKPTKVIEQVEQAIGKKFIMANHTNAWKYYKIRPSEKNSTNCDEKYVKWSGLTNSYLYTKRWVSFLIKELNKLDIYEKICELKLK